MMVNSNTKPHIEKIPTLSFQTTWVHTVESTTQLYYGYTTRVKH